MELTEKEQQKIHQNESENNVYKVQLDKFFNKQMPTHEIINVCSTPNILKIFNSTAKKVVLSQKDLQNAVSAASLGNKGHKEGHDIAKSEIYKLPESIRSPILMLKGNNRNSNSVVMLTEMINKKGENVFVPIALDRQKGKISNISTLYGKKNLSQYLSDHLSDILAINIKKADVLANIGVQFPKSIYETVVCFDNSIAYSTANVKYISEIFQNFFKKEKSTNEETERNDNVAESTQELLSERIASFSIFIIESGGERAYFRDDNTDVNTFLQRLADCNEKYPEFLKGCTEISGEEFAVLEQMEKPLPVFCAEINLSDKELSIWDNDKIASVNLKEAIQSIKASGTVNLDYQKFAENNDTVELTREYLDLSQHLDDVYNNFLHHNSIFDSEHINFAKEHGNLPANLNTAENRAVVSEYINIHLDIDSNLSESQKETLTELKNEISKIERMETEFGIDEGDLNFITETKSIKAYTDEAKEKYSDRNIEFDEHERDDPF